MVMTWMNLSNTPFLRTAVAMPSGMEMANTTSIDTALSISVLSIGVPMTSMTSRLYWVEYPKLPVSMLPIQMKYCTTSGLSRPSCK